MNATPYPWFPSFYRKWKMFIIILILQTVINKKEEKAHVWRHVQLVCAFFLISILKICFFLSLALPPFLWPFFFFLKGSLSKSNTVSLSMTQLQSPALWSGPSILSPTSWLFKRAKAQQCSFLNTQIHPSTNRGTAVGQKSVSLSLSLQLSFLTLDSDTPTPITHAPAQTLLYLCCSLSLSVNLSLSLSQRGRCLAQEPLSLTVSISDCLSLSLSTPHLCVQLPHLSFVPFLTLTPSVSYLTLSTPPPSFTFFSPSPATSSAVALHPVVPCLPSIFAATQSLSPPLPFASLPDETWLMPSLGFGPSLLPHTHTHRRGHHDEPKGDCHYLKQGIQVEGGNGRFGQKGRAHPCLRGDRLGEPLGGEHELVH